MTDHMIINKLYNKINIKMKFVVFSAKMLFTFTILTISEVYASPSYKDSSNMIGTDFELINY